MNERIHKPCGQLMIATFFGPTDPTPTYRAQPIWSCDGCQAWEPREGWNGDLPADWDGRAWRTT